MWFFLPWTLEERSRPGSEIRGRATSRARGIRRPAASALAQARLALHRDRELAGGLVARGIRRRAIDQGRAGGEGAPRWRYGLDDGQGIVVIRGRDREGHGFAGAIVEVIEHGDGRRTGQHGGSRV